MINNVTLRRLNDLGTRSVDGTIHQYSTSEADVANHVSVTVSILLGQHSRSDTDE